MVPLTEANKQYLFGAAGKKAGITASAKKTFRKSKGGNPSGMLMAVGLDSTTPTRPAPKTKKTTSTAASDRSKKLKAKFEEINKYGLIALSAATIINHAHNTTHKLIAAAHGDMDKFKIYEERSKSYLKPHFSLPSYWNQPRITFGTPWYY